MGEGESGSRGLCVCVRMCETVRGEGTRRRLTKTNATRVCVYMCVYVCAGRAWYGSAVASSVASPFIALDGPVRARTSLCAHACMQKRWGKQVYIWQMSPISCVHNCPMPVERAHIYTHARTHRSRRGERACASSRRRWGQRRRSGAATSSGYSSQSARARGICFFCCMCIWCVFGVLYGGGRRGG